MSDGLSVHGAVGRATAALVGSIRAEPRARLVAPGGAEMAGPGAERSGIDPTAIAELVELTRRLVFPGFFEPRGEPVREAWLEVHVAGLTAALAERMAAQVGSVLRYRRRCEAGKSSRTATAGGEADSGGPDGGGPVASGPIASGPDAAWPIATAFLERLPEVRRLLALDVQAAYDGDPAAEHTDEVILCYPGLDAVFAHRIAHELHRLGVPILPRIVAEQAHTRTGIDIHPGASIGESFFIDHGSGTVIGETTVIGRQVKVYQGVTLGARSFAKDEAGHLIRGTKRHPTIGDRVTIYAGAVILGGDTTIGDDCVIAGGVFLTSSVAEGHVVRQTWPDLTLRPHGPGERSVEMWGEGI